MRGAYQIRNRGRLYVWFSVSVAAGSIMILLNKDGNIVAETNYGPWGRVRNPDNYVQNPNNPQNYNRYTYALNNPLMYVDPDGEFFWIPVIIGAVIEAYMGGTLANNDYNPANWDYSSGKTWGYMLGGAIVGGISGYIGAKIAATDIPMANTLGIAGASFTNSVGTYMYTGGQTDISVSFGVASYNFTKKNGGYLGKEGNSVFDDIGYSIGAVVNVIDLHRYWTWDVLTREEQIAKLQKKYPGLKISYDSKLTTAEGKYENGTLYIGDEGLKYGFGWAKSTIEHEFTHFYDDIIGIPRSENLLEYRAYITELHNASKNGLTFSQFKDVEMRLLQYNTELTISELPKYNFKLWILSIIKR